MHKQDVKVENLTWDAYHYCCTHCIKNVYGIFFV